MNLYLPTSRSLAILLMACLIFSCQNAPESGKADTASAQPEVNQPEPVAAPPRAIASASTVNIDCSVLLTTEMIEEHCKASNIKERITSIERKGATCNRTYGLDKAWGDELIFIVSPKSDGATSFNKMKDDNAANGLQELSDIGDGAFALSFKDKLSGRQQEQLVFHKKNLLIELKAQESRSAKTPCPCYNAAQLKSLATAIAAKIQ